VYKTSSDTCQLPAKSLNAVEADSSAINCNLTQARFAFCPREGSAIRAFVFYAAVSVSPTAARSSIFINVALPLDVPVTELAVVRMCR